MQGDDFAIHRGALAPRFPVARAAAAHAVGVVGAPLGSSAPEAGAADVRATSAAPRKAGTGVSARSCWSRMVARCTRPDDLAFGKYGGRGIKVCDRWRESFEAFLADMGPRPSMDHSIDRYPNPRGNYEPGNCRWATREEQARNRTDSVLLTLDGVTMCVVAWAEKLGIRAGAIFNRLDRGWSVEDALRTPIRPRAAQKEWHAENGRPMRNGTRKYSGVRVQGRFTDRCTEVIDGYQCLRAPHDGPCAIPGRVRIGVEPIEPIVYPWTDIGGEGG